MEYHYDDGGESVEAYGSRATPAQIDLIMSHYRRNDAIVTDVQAEYDVRNGDLILSGTPRTTARFARQSLEEAIRAAQVIHPSGNLDMSA
ncbi:MAG: hypothetical protein QG649_553 [Patescibacteria group bacterium]|nr:hypothetical protein [Patescibacteria group bacterium]